MKVSASKEYEGYVRNTMDIKVIFNGVYQKYCVFADSDNGKIVRYLLDENGRIKLDELRDAPATETVYGKVRIVVPSGWIGITPENVSRE